MGAGMVGREEGGGGRSQQRGRQGAVNKTRSLELHSHYAAIHEICQPFGFHALHAFLRLFRKDLFFFLSLSLVSNSEETVSPIHAHLPRQPPARLSLLFTFKVTKRNRGITRRIWTRISFFHSSVIQTRIHVQIPLRCRVFYFILENYISFLLIIRNNYTD